MRSQGRTIAESPTESQRGGVADPDPAARRVSVILPVRDGHATIDEALGSLVAQTHRRLEVVVVDDGSRDATPSILGRWIRRDPRIRVVRTQRRGLVAALQRGLAEAEGEFVARMDADDIAHPARLAVQLAFLTHNPELSGCGARVRRVPAGDIPPRAAAYIAWLNAMIDWKTVAANLFVECPLAHPTFLFRARALAEVGGYRDRGWPEDYDLLLRLWRRGHRFAAAPRTLLDWRDSAGRLSRTSPAYSLNAFRACRVHHLRQSLLGRRTGVVVWGAGPTGKALAREFRRQGVAAKAFVEVDRRKIGQTIHAVAVVAVADAPGVAAADGGALHVGAVARAEGRAGVRRAAMEAGLVEGVDFVAMA